MSKQEKKKLVPVLRFPEFRDSGEWEEKNLGDLCEITNGKSNAQDHIEGGFYPLFDRSEVIKRSNEYLFDCEAVILPGEGMRFIPKYYVGKFDLHQRAYALKDFSCKGKFIYYSMAARSGLLARKAVQSTVLSLRLPILQNFQIQIPGVPEEQQKIADCLTSIDELVTAQTQKLDALKAHKKGLMQQLFPAEGETVPKLRFPEFRDKGEWVEMTLGDVSDVRDGTHDSPKYHNTGKPLITSKNLLSDGSLDLENVSLISEEDFNKINKRSRVNVGDILFGMIGTIGNPVMVKTDGFAIKNVALIKQKAALKNCYLVHFLNSQYIATKLSILNAGNSQKFVALSQIRSLVLPVPAPPEQHEIADVLSSLDELITAQAQKVVTLKAHKKGLMQLLFPAMDEVRA